MPYFTEQCDLQQRGAESLNGRTGTRTQLCLPGSQGTGCGPLAPAGPCLLSAFHPCSVPKVPELLLDGVVGQPSTPMTLGAKTAEAPEAESPEAEVGGGGLRSHKQAHSSSRFLGLWVVSCLGRGPTQEPS